MVSFIPGSTSENIYEGTTEALVYDGDNSYYSQEFTTHIYPATSYEFSVKLVAPDMETYGALEMQSDEEIVTCYSKPSKLLGNSKSTICHDGPCIRLKWNIMKRIGE